jgi:hypothetical protein
MNDGAPHPIPNGDRELARILRELDERDISDEPGIVDADIALPVELPQKPGSPWRGYWRDRDDG